MWGEPSLSRITSIPPRATLIDPIHTASLDVAGAAAASAVWIDHCNPHDRSGGASATFNEHRLSSNRYGWNRRKPAARNLAAELPLRAVKRPPR
jgi:hypothetical protein